MQFAKALTSAWNASASDIMKALLHAALEIAKRQLAAQGSPA